MVKSTKKRLIPAVADMRKSTPRVYSYARFSTPEQAKGDSERRQDERATIYANKIGLPFDKALHMIDRGLSAYHGAHRKKGALGQFLKSVESGEVPKGSILVVENIDRLGREEVLDALETIVFGLVKHDIVIQTLFSREDLQPRVSERWANLGTDCTHRTCSRGV